MNDETGLLEQFIRVVRDKSGEVVMEVGVVRWLHPHTPTVDWKLLKAWRGEPTQAEIDLEGKRAIADPRYFRVCETCSARHNVGHMHDQRVCQGCAERDLHVVH